MMNMQKPIILIIILFAWVKLAYSEQEIAFPKEITSKDGAVMVLIPAGEFQMGSETGVDEEKPVHTVYLDTFYMDKYEVTNAQYKRFILETGHKEPEGRGFKDGEFRDGFKPWSDKRFSGDNQPIIYVTWEDAKAYAEWASKRLPTEAEWEKAARGGLAEKEYSWGNIWPPPKGIGNLADESGKAVSPKWRYIVNYNDGYAYTASVGSFKPNSYGLYDMVGNVREWCNDWKNEEYYAKSPRKNPAGPNTGEVRVVRGNNWYDFDPYWIRVAKRCVGNPLWGNEYTGFRCVITADKVSQ